VTLNIVGFIAFPMLPYYKMPILGYHVELQPIALAG